MLGLSDLEKLRDAYSAHSGATLDEALRQIGNPTLEAIAASAAEQMTKADRNKRILALRVLARQPGDIALRAVLAGLHDEKRRVCAAAIQACPNFMGYEAIAARLEAIARDAGLKRKLRRRALSMLAGDDGRLQGDLTPAAYAALRRLMPEAEYRFAILFGLVRLKPGTRVTALLQAFAKSADEAERRMAGRALMGERVAHIDGYAADKAMKRWIMDACDIAYGRMYYWLPGDG